MTREPRVTLEIRVTREIRGDPGTVDSTGGFADLLTTARARVAARRDDIGEIRPDAIRDARAKRAYADQELTRKQAIEQRQQLEAEAAAARLAEARQAAAESLAAWTARWTVRWAAAADTTSPAAPPSLAVVTASLPRGVIVCDDAATLAAAPDRIGEPGAASLSEIYDGCVSDRQGVTIAARTSLDAALAGAPRRLAHPGKSAKPSPPSG